MPETADALRSDHPGGVTAPEPLDAPHSPWRGRVTATVLLALAGIALAVLLLSCGAGTSTGRMALPASSASPVSSASPGMDEVVVYVSGRVRDPGVYRLSRDARIGDAVERAGGPLEDADVAQINLARRVIDGEQIHLPAVGAAGSASEPMEERSDPGLINLNRATAEQLQQLPRIGEATAEKIIADREANGPFSSVDDLTRVSGIGEKTVEGLRTQATV